MSVLLLAAAARADTLESPECVVHFPAAASRKAARILETFPARLEYASEWLGVKPLGRATVHLVPDLDAVRALAPGAPSWCVAVTAGDTIIFRLDRVDRNPTDTLDLVLKHEMVHLVLGAARARPPRWFEEGLAVHHAGVAYFEPDTTIERFAAAGNLPRFADAARLFEGNASEAGLGYKFGQRVADAVVARFGDDVVRRLVRALGAGRPFAEAFEDATGEPLPAFERRFREEVTPRLPFWLFVIVENLYLALLCAAAILAGLGYLRWRLRRERAMSGLGGVDPPA